MKDELRANNVHSFIPLGGPYNVWRGGALEDVDVEDMLKRLPEMEEEEHREFFEPRPREVRVLFLEEDGWPTWASVTRLLSVRHFLAPDTAIDRALAQRHNLRWVYYLLQPEPERFTIVKAETSLGVSL